MPKKAFFVFLQLLRKRVYIFKGKQNKNLPEHFKKKKTEKAHKHNGDELWTFTAGSGSVIIGFKYEIIELNKEYLMPAGIDHCIIVKDELTCKRVRFRDAADFKTIFKEDDDERGFNRLMETILKEEMPKEKYIRIVRK